jgi:hypothetical protein
MTAHPHFARASALEHLKHLRSSGAELDALVPALEAAAKLCTGDARALLDAALNQVKAGAVGDIVKQAIDLALGAAITDAVTLGELGRAVTFADLEATGITLDELANITIEDLQERSHG